MSAVKLVLVVAISAVFRAAYATQWFNETLHNDGEIYVKSSSAKVEGEHPHKVHPITSDHGSLLSQENLNPIIIVPGYRNSELEATIIKNKWSLPWCKNKWDYFQIWFKLKNFKPYLIDCWVRRLV